MQHKPRKRFGQHFLTDAHYLARVVKAISPRPGDSMVEIGPGTGLLTAELSRVVSGLQVIEIDRELAAHLRLVYRDGGVIVHEADVLDFDFRKLASPLRIVGNLPYNVSTPILFRVAEIADRVADCVFMLQREVVDRMVAAPDTPDYGRLSVMLQYRFEMALAVKVPPGAFTPPPKVDSAVVRMKPLGPKRPRARDEALFAKVVAAAFAQRRKTLRNATKLLVAPEAFARTGVDPSRRGETLSVGEFIVLTDAAAASR